MLIPVLFGVALLYWTGLYVFAPTLPVYVQNKTADLAVVGAVLSMYGLWQFLARLPVGIAADWAGMRKPFIAGGLSIVAGGALILAGAQGVPALVLGRALTGVGAATWVPLVVLFSSLYDSRDVIRATGLMSLASTIGRMIGTASNGPLNRMGGYLPAFYVSAGVLAAAVLIVLAVPESKRPAQAPSPGRLAGLFLRRDVLAPSLLSALLHYGDWAATFSFIPILARQFGADNLLVGLLVTLNLGVVLLGNLAVGWLGSRAAARTLIAAAFGLMAVGLAGAGLAPGLPWLIAAQLAIGLGFGFGYPVLMGASIRGVDGSERNSAMGLHQSVYAIGMFAGPWLSGILASRLGIQPMFGVTAAVLLGLSLMGARAIRE